MVPNPPSPPSSLFPPQPFPDGAEAFSRQIHSLLDGRPKDEASVRGALAGMDAVFDRLAANLYNLASMLVGEGEESALLVETAVANADVANCITPHEVRMCSRRALAQAALAAMERRYPGSLAAPAVIATRPSCMEDDDLESGGMSAAELERILAGADRDRVRAWLAELPTPVRTVFALRAVAGFTAQETAALLTVHSAATAPWTTEAVRDLFRQGLCSLASQLFHASAAR